jgi:RNA polymerase sigma-70 factor (ECF subfamily)
MAFREDLIEIIPSLRAFAVSLCGNRDKADDLVQEALTKAWAKKNRFEAGTNFKAWMFTILRNHYYSQFRKARREVADSDGILTASLAVHPEQQGHIDLAEMRAALQKLPDHQREAIILVAAEGLSYEEVANICDCAVGTIKSRVNRARAQLTAMLNLSDVSDYGPDEHVASIITKEVTVSSI